MFLDQFLFELSCKNTETHTHTQGCTQRLLRVHYGCVFTKAKILSRLSLCKIHVFLNKNNPRNIHTLYNILEYDETVILSDPRPRNFYCTLEQYVGMLR